MPLDFLYPTNPSDSLSHDAQRASPAQRAISAYCWARLRPLLATAAPDSRADSLNSPDSHHLKPYLRLDPFRKPPYLCTATPRRQRASERRAKSVSVFFRGFVKRGRKGSTNLHVEGVRRHRRDCGAHSSGHAPHSCSNFAWGVNGALGRPDQYLATPSYPRHAISVFLYRRRPWVQWKPRED